MNNDNHYVPRFLSPDWQPPIFPQAGASSNFPMFWPTQPQMAQFPPGGFVEPFGPQFQHHFFPQAPHPHYIPPPPMPPIFHIRQPQSGITNPQGQFEYPPEVLQSTSAATVSEAGTANSSDTKSDTALNSSRSRDGTQTKAVMDNTGRERTGKEPEKNENSAGATKKKKSGMTKDTADKPQTQEGHSSQQKASCAEIITIDSPNTSGVSNSLNEQNQPNSLPTTQDNEGESSLNRRSQKQQHRGLNRPASFICNAEDNTPTNSSLNNSEQNLNTSTNVASNQEMDSNSGFNEEYKEAIQKLKKQFPEYGSILSNVDENRPLASIAQPLLSSNIDGVHTILRSIRESRQEQQQTSTESDETEFNLAIAEEDLFPSNMNHHSSTDETATPVTPQSPEDDATVPPGPIQPRRSAENSGSKVGDPRIMRVSGQSDRSSTDSTVAASQITPSCSNSAIPVTQFGGIIFKPLQNSAQPRPKSPQPSTSSSNSLTISPSLNDVFPEASTTGVSKKPHISVKLGQNSVMADAQGANKSNLWDSFKQQMNVFSSSNLTSTSLSEEPTPEASINPTEDYLSVMSGHNYSDSSTGSSLQPPPLPPRFPKPRLILSPNKPVPLNQLIVSDPRKDDKEGGSASSSTTKIPRADGSHLHLDQSDSRKKSVKVAPSPVPPPLQLNVTGQNTKSTSKASEKPLNKDIPPLPREPPPNNGTRDAIPPPPPPPPERKEERRRDKTVDPRIPRPGPVSSSSRDSSENKTSKGHESRSNHDESRDRKRDKSKDDTRNPMPRPAAVSVSNRSSGSSELLSPSGEGRDGRSNANEIQSMRSGPSENMGRRERHSSGNPQISPALTASSSESSAEFRSPRTLEPCSARTKCELQKPIVPLTDDEKRKFNEKLRDFKCLKTAEMDLRWRRHNNDTLAKSEFEKQQLERTLTDNWNAERFQLERQLEAERNLKQNLAGRLNTLNIEIDALRGENNEMRTTYDNSLGKLWEQLREVSSHRDRLKDQLATQQNQPSTSTAPQSHVDELERKLQKSQEEVRTQQVVLTDMVNEWKETKEFEKMQQEELESTKENHAEEMAKVTKEFEENHSKWKRTYANLQARHKLMVDKLMVEKDADLEEKIGATEKKPDTMDKESNTELSPVDATSLQNAVNETSALKASLQDTLQKYNEKIRHENKEYTNLKIRFEKMKINIRRAQDESEQLKIVVEEQKQKLAAMPCRQTSTNNDAASQTPPRRRCRDGSTPSSTTSRSSSRESQLQNILKTVTNTSCRPLTANAQGPSNASEQNIAEIIRANEEIIILSDDESPSAADSQPSASGTSVQQASTAGPTQKRKANTSTNKEGPMTDSTVCAAKRSCNTDNPQGSQNRVLDALPLQSVMTRPQATANAPNTSASVEAPVSIPPPVVTQNRATAPAGQNIELVEMGFAVAQNPTTGKEEDALKEEEEEIIFVKTSKKEKKTSTAKVKAPVKVKDEFAPSFSVQPTIAPAESTSAESPPLLVLNTEESAAPPRSPTGVCDSTEPGNRSRHSSGIGHSSIQQCPQLQPQISRQGMFAPQFTNPGQQQNANLSGMQPGSQAMDVAFITLQGVLSESGNTASPNQQNQYSINPTPVVQMNPALMSNNPWPSLVQQNQIPFPQSQPRPMAQQMGTVHSGIMAQTQNFPNQPTNMPGTHIIQQHPQRTFNTDILNHFRHLPHNQAQMNPSAQNMQQARNVPNVQLSGAGPMGYGSQQPNSSPSCQAAAEQRIVQSFCVFLQQHRSFASVSRSDLLIAFCNQQQIARELQPDVIRQLEPLVDAFNAMLQENALVVFNRQKNQSS
ncbi:hypothetical protein Ddc_03625 [Ditylenchus destructor]|nr:hypothetical protein Ddc_03625 [Ditylenchus destructor]